MSEMEITVTKLAEENESREHWTVKHRGVGTDKASAVRGNCDLHAAFGQGSFSVQKAHIDRCGMWRRCAWLASAASMRGGLLSSQDY